MQVTINNKKYRCKEGETILDAAKRNNICIPTLCYQEDFRSSARCRMCVVEADGRIVTSCSTKVCDGMNVFTETEKVLRYRKLNAELLMAQHQDSCFVGNKNHDLCKIAKDVGLREVRFKPRKDVMMDIKGSSIARHNEKCIVCGRCVKTCKELQCVHAIDFASRSHHTHVTPFFEKSLGEVLCINCGQCIINCPVEAITEKENIDDVAKVLNNPKKIVVAQTAPAIRVSLGEEFDMEPGTNVKGKMVSALKRLGFDSVFDTNTGADFTIMEEASELIERIQKGKNLPLITSCCPGWIKFAEHYYHGLLKNISSCKSPHEMLGSLIKSYYAKKINKNPRDIVVISIMPCTAKKFEAARKELKNSVDYVLTTRELAKMIKSKGIKLRDLKKSKFDDPLGISTGAAAIFGATGGVMEAALRTAADVLTGKELKKIDYKGVRGLKGIKDASIKIGNKKLRVAVVHGMGNAKRLIDSGIKKYHFIEIMACPGGCIGGGGQPIPTNNEIRQKRIDAIYKEDKSLAYRKSHKNPTLIKVYKEFLGKPLGRKSEELLHTSYVKRRLY